MTKNEKDLLARVHSKLKEALSATEQANKKMDECLKTLSDSDLKTIAECIINHKRPPNSHFGMTQRCWENARRGVLRCKENEQDLVRCLEACRASIKKGHSKTWLHILDGRLPGRMDEVLATENFFDLPDDQMRFWENHIQNHPFAVLFAFERYEKLKKEKEE